MAESGKKAGFVEKRKAARSPVLVLKVKGRYYEKVFLAHTRDVSRNGLSWLSQQPLSVGDRFPVELVLPDGTTTLRCTCEVMWTKELKTGGLASTGVGVRFVDLGNEQKRLIDDWIIQSERARIPRPDAPIHRN